jgi:hypothetical protein
MRQDDRCAFSGASKPSFKKPMKFADSPACDNSPSMLASNIEMQESGEATALLDDLGYLLVGCALPHPPPPPLPARAAAPRTRDLTHGPVAGWHLFGWGEHQGQAPERTAACGTHAIGVKALHCARPRVSPASFWVLESCGTCRGNYVCLVFLQTNLAVAPSCLPPRAAGLGRRGSALVSGSVGLLVVLREVRSAPCATLARTHRAAFWFAASAIA